MPLGILRKSTTVVFTRRRLTMFRTSLGVVCAILLLAESLAALEAVGTLKKIDADKGVVVVFANGQDRTLKLDKNTKFLDLKGQELADGSKAKEFKEGADV